MQDLQVRYSHTSWRDVRIVGIAVKESGDIAFRKHLLKFLLESGTAIFIDIELLRLYAEHLGLRYVSRETGVEKKHGVFLLKTLRQQQLQREASLHRSDCRNNAFARDVYIEESLDEFRAGLLQFGNTLDGGIFIGHAAFKSMNLGPDTDLFGFKTRIADLEMNHRLAGLALDLSGKSADLAYGGGTEVKYHETSDDSIERIFIYWKHNESVD